MEKTISKWYENKGLLDTLLFVLPPIAIVGILLNRKMKTTFRVILSIFGFVMCFVWAIGLHQWISS